MPDPKHSVAAALAALTLSTAAAPASAQVAMGMLKTAGNTGTRATPLLDRLWEPLQYSIPGFFLTQVNTPEQAQVFRNASIASLKRRAAECVDGMAAGKYPNGCVISTDVNTKRMQTAADIGPMQIAMHIRPDGVDVLVRERFHDKKHFDAYVPDSRVNFGPMPWNGNGTYSIWGLRLDSKGSIEEIDPLKLDLKTFGITHPLKDMMPGIRKPGEESVFTPPAGPARPAGPVLRT